jgi:hypothetical protein
LTPFAADDADTEPHSLSGRALLTSGAAGVLARIGTIGGCRVDQDGARTVNTAHELALPSVAEDLGQFATPRSAPMLAPELPEPLIGLRQPCERLGMNGLRVGTQSRVILPQGTRQVTPGSYPEPVAPEPKLGPCLNLWRHPSMHPANVTAADSPGAGGPGRDRPSHLKLPPDPAHGLPVAVRGLGDDLVEAVRVVQQLGHSPPAGPIGQRSPASRGRRVSLRPNGLVLRMWRV